MNKRTRTLIGVIVMIISLSLLIWSLRPMGHEVRTEPISPAELQLPTPASLLIQPELVS